MPALLVAFLCAAPVFESFDEPPDPGRWYVGVGQAPRNGALRVAKGGWLVSRGVPDEGLRAIEVEFRHRGGALEVTFHDAREPLSGAVGDPLLVKKGKGVRKLTVTGAGASLDGAALDWTGEARGTFRLRAVKGDVELIEVRVEPRASDPAEPTALERNNVHFLTTPTIYREEKRSYARSNVMIWDVEVTLLVARGETACRPLRAPVRGAPTLAALVECGDAGALALKAAAHPLAMRDWGDERGNLGRGGFIKYVKGEYALFGVLEAAQQALILAVPERDDLAPMVALAVVRHSPNPHAALALAETRGNKRAVALMRKVLGKGVDPARASSDRLRAAAGQAARELLGEPPAAWPGFSFDPMNRFVTMQQARELVR